MAKRDPGDCEAKAAIRRRFSHCSANRNPAPKTAEYKVGGASDRGSPRSWALSPRAQQRQATTEVAVR